MIKRIGLTLLACILAVMMLVVVLTLAGCGQGAEPAPELAQIQSGWLDRVYSKAFTFHTEAVTNANGTAAYISGYPVVGVQVQGITGTATINFETTIDGTNWDAVQAVDTSDGSVATTTAADGQYLVPTDGKQQLRVRISGYSDGGTITVTGYGETHTGAVNVANASLAANAGVNIGDVTLAATATVTNVTGAAAIDVDYAPGSAFWLESVTLNLSAAPTTSQNFTIALDAGDGAVYDTVLYTLDLSLGSVTDLLFTPDDGPLLCESGDAIDVDFTNTDVVTYGLRIVVRLAE